MAENALARKASRKEIVSLARQTVQFAEDARALGVERQEQERILNERAAAAAQAKAEAEALKAKEEAARAEAERSRRAAEELRSVRPSTGEHLAKLSGIILAHPGLHLDVEGNTDSTGSDELNQRLSDQRADTVRSYLISQGLASDCITAQGFGETMPITSNETAAGRQKNRRVELIVSGEVIGLPIGVKNAKCHRQTH